MADLPGFSDVLAAAERISPYVHRTVVMTCTDLSRRVGAQVHFKCENLQRVGAFKVRGATNTVFSLGEDEIARGVATHSSGNHGQALALAASLRGAHASVVMPKNASAVKRAAVGGYGAGIIDCEPTQQSREETLAAHVAETGATVVHPYNDARVIAGQGTAALEMLQQVPALDLILVPVGGGGLASGTALAAHGGANRVRVVGVEPEGADDAMRSLAAGRVIPVEHPRTIADGLRATVGELPLAIMKQHLEEIVTVDDEAIVAAMRYVWERLKLVIEASAAVPVAALLAGRIRNVGGQRVGVILSGGNVDLDRLPWVPE